MLQSLIDLISRLGHWGYAIVFLAAALECAAFVGLIVPGESIVLASGFFAAQGLFDLVSVMLVIAAGAVIGDNIGYELGRHLGRPWLLRYGRHVGVRKAQLDRADAFFARHGGNAVFFGRFVGFARALVPFVAGSSRMRYRQFLIYNAAGGLLWTVGFVLLGYSLGESWRVAERWVGRAGLLIGIALVAAVLGVWLWRRRGRRQL